VKQQRFYPLEHATAILNHIPAYMVRDRDTWAKILAGFQDMTREAGREAAEAWSRSDNDNFNAADFNDTWRSFSPGGGRGFGTVIHYAQTLGGYDLANDNAPDVDPAVATEALARFAREDEAARKAKQRAQGDAAREANLIWKRAAQPCPLVHSYITAKGINPPDHLDAAIGEWPRYDADTGEVLPPSQGVMLVPIRDTKTGKIISLQGVFSNGRKSYLKGGRKLGGFNMIGLPPKPGEILAFCEGWATGASIHEATGWPVVVTFDSGNLPVVAKAMRGEFPHAAFIICGDDDSATGGNPGVTKANEAGTACNGVVIIPKFATSGTGTDFNDLHQEEGIETVRSQLHDNPITQRAVTAPANDNTPALVPKVVDRYAPLQHINGQGKPLATIENLQEILERLGVSIRYDVIRKGYHISFPGKDYLPGYGEADALIDIQSEAAQFQYPDRNVIPGYLDRISHLPENVYSPVLAYINSCPWDGKPRFADLLKTIKTAKGFPERLLEIYMRRWAISAVAAAYMPEGFEGHGVVVFQGPQGIGKSRWCRKLVSQDAKGLIMADAAINPSDKDSVLRVLSFWIAELGEIDAMLKPKNSAIKSLLTRALDALRPPYAKADRITPRRTVFLGTVNPKVFLTDPTGNRRYWTIPVIELDHSHDIDMQQVWAEVATWYEAGEQWWLAKDEAALMNEQNKDHEQIPEIAEMLRDLYAGQIGDLRRMSSTELTQEMGVKPPVDRVALKAEADRLFGPQKRGGEGERYWLVPPMRRPGNEHGPL